VQVNHHRQGFPGASFNGSEHIEVEGTVIDGNGDLVRDAFVEAWQADASGNYQVDYDLSKPFNSFGRTATPSITVANGR
jgi:protocatechuate 3,4-dioxygenase beta subunit